MKRVLAYATFTLLGALVPAAGCISMLGVPTRTRHSPGELLAWFAIPVFLAAINLWTSQGRALFWNIRHGSLDGYRWVSGFPAIGTIATAIAALGTWGDLTSGIVVMVLSLVDTGSMTWFAIQCFRHRAFDA